VSTSLSPARCRIWPVWHARHRWPQHRATMRTCPAKTTRCWWRLGNVSAH
jgi:hypothetical protein